MEDKDIIALYLARIEEAITQTKEKYDSYCHSIARRILWSKEDAMECVNDGYLQVWNTIPPQIPQSLKNYLGCIVRNISINRLDYLTAKKRKGEICDVIDEFYEILDGLTPGSLLEDEVELRILLNQFLSSMPKQQRMMFVKRYWFGYSVKEISRDMQCTESKVKVTLHRMREKLREIVKEDMTYGR